MKHLLSILCLFVLSCDKEPIFLIECDEESIEDDGECIPICDEGFFWHEDRISENFPDYPINLNPGDN